MREIIGPRKTVPMVVRMTPQLHKETIKAAWRERVSAAEFTRRAIEARIAEAKERAEKMG